MNKIIFQIGLLAFFISLAVFSLQSVSLFESIIRAFIVFVAVEVISMFGIVLVAWNSEDKGVSPGKRESDEKIQPQGN